MTVRPASPADLRGLPAVEAAADVLFGPDLPPGTAGVEELAAAAAVLVVGDPPVGFARLEVVDGLAHLEQLAVHPDHGRRGLGSALLAGAVEWAREKGFRAITLTTYADLPWNGPFYRRHGFTDVEPGPELRALRTAETAAGLDVLGRRVALGQQLSRSDR